MQMSKTEMLIIRAVKSNSSKRLNKVLSRQYLYGMTKADKAAILTNIVNNYKLCSVHTLVKELNPNQSWMYGLDDNCSYDERVIAVMSSIIRLTSVSSLMQYGFIPPTRFKR